MRGVARGQFKMSDTPGWIASTTHRYPEHDGLIERCPIQSLPVMNLTAEHKGRAGAAPSVPTVSRPSPGIGFRPYL